jgi:hypothetical protein
LNLWFMLSQLLLVPCLDGLITFSNILNRNKDNVTDHIKNKLPITKDQRSDIMSNLFGDNGIINTSSLPIRMSMHCTLLSKRAFTCEKNVLYVQYDASTEWCNICWKLSHNLMKCNKFWTNLTDDGHYRHFWKFYQFLLFCIALANPGHVISVASTIGSGFM